MLAPTGTTSLPAFFPIGSKGRLTARRRRMNFKPDYWPAMRQVVWGASTAAPA